MIMLNNLYNLIFLIIFLIYIFYPSSKDFFSILTFAIALILIFVEIYKLTLGKRHLDDLKGIKKFLFSEEGSKDIGLFAKETLFSAKGLRLFWIWIVFLLSVGYVIWYVITHFILG